MANPGLIPKHVEQVYNISLLADLLEDLGIVSYSESFREKNYFGSGILYDKLQSLYEDPMINKFYPSIAGVAKKLYAEPVAAKKILNPGFTVTKDLNDYGISLISLDCVDFFSLGFRDFNNVCFHQAWTTQRSNPYEPSPFGRVLLKYRISNEPFSTMEEYEKRTIVFETFFERVGGKIRHEGYSLSSKTFCPVCSMQKVIISETSCVNSEAELKNFLQNWGKEAYELKDSWAVLVGLR